MPRSGAACPSYPPTVRQGRPGSTTTRTGTLKGVNREYEGITPQEAVVKQAEMRGEIRCCGRSDQKRRDRYGDYAESLFERKQSTGELKSAKSRERWADTQDGHLIPAFGDWYIDQIRRNDIEEWKADQAKRVGRGKLSPHTVNGWLPILLTTLRRALVDLDLEYDPTKGIKPLDTSTWHTYTEEQPNSLTVGAAFHGQGAGAVPATLRHAGAGARDRTQAVRAATAAPERADAGHTLGRRRALGPSVGGKGRGDGSDQDRQAAAHPSATRADGHPAMARGQPARRPHARVRVQTS